MIHTFHFFKISNVSILQSNSKFHLYGDEKPKVNVLIVGGQGIELDKGSKKLWKYLLGDII